MFTGIIEAVGRVARCEACDGDLRLSIDCPSDFLDGAATTALGDSIAVSGVCLTVVSRTASQFTADVSRETLACTTLGEWQVGRVVNLEKAMLPTTRMGGHLVSAHVDGVGQLLEVCHDARSQRWRFAMPEAIAPFVAAKGSICVDGVSLTVNEVADDAFEVNLVPHTISVTAFRDYGAGRRVNLEVDVVARYVARLVNFPNASSGETE